MDTVSPTPTLFGTDPTPSRHGKPLLALGLAAMITVPGLVLRFGGLHPNTVLSAVLFGVSIIGAAFLLAWGAEALEVDISAGLAIAILALIAVLPEYAVDAVFSWKGGKAFALHGPACKAAADKGEAPCPLALANMTGSNRLLIGIGWSLVMLMAYIQWRRRNMATREITLSRTNSVEITYLALATLYGLTLPLKRTLTLLDAVVLVGLFLAYTVRIARAPAEEPDLAGPAKFLGEMPKRKRRISVGATLLFAAVVILACAERFAEALVQTGQDAGISEFLLVQWVAPLASEAPELLVASLFAWRLATSDGLGTLVSSKVNQWTLLVGTLPIVFGLASSGGHGLPLDAAQREELFITAAQAFFAVAVLVNLKLSTTEALWLFGMFWAQFIVGAVVPERWHGAERIGVGVVYLVLGVFLLLRQRHRFMQLLRDGLRTPYHELAEHDDAEAVAVSD
jgi:cation:H+ antiporter